MNTGSTSVCADKLDIIQLKTINGKKCIVKRLNDDYFSHYLELEVSRRLADCDQIYKVLNYYIKDSTIYVVSEYVEGVDMYDNLDMLTEQQILSLLCQILLLINLINKAGVSHNDLHLRNIRVQKTKATTLTYDTGGRIYELPSYGVKAVIIDFGMATITTPSGLFQILSNHFYGTCFLQLDIRYDMYRFLSAFVGSLLVKFPSLAGFSWVTLFKFIHTEVMKPQKIVDTYYDLQNIIVKHFKNYLAVNKTRKIYFSRKFVYYMTMFPRSGKLYTEANISKATTFLTVATMKTIDRMLVDVLTNLPVFVPPELEWVQVISFAWDQFLKTNQKLLQAQIDEVFLKTRFQNPLDLVDVIITTIFVS